MRLYQGCCILFQSIATRVKPIDRLARLLRAARPVQALIPLATTDKIRTCEVYMHAALNVDPWHLVSIFARGTL